MFNFASIYMMMKVKSSRFVLAWGNGCTFILSFIISVFLGFLSYWLYEVPVSDVQLYVSRVKEYNKKGNGCDIIMRFNYGMGIYNTLSEDRGVFVILKTQNYDGSKFPGGTFYSSTCSYSRYGKKEFFYSAADLEKLYEDSICKFVNFGRQNKVRSIYQIDWILSAPPKTYLNITPHDIFYYCKPILKDSVGNMVESSYVAYESTNKGIDTISNKYSYNVLNYIYLYGYTENTKVPVSILKSLYEPQFYSLYDISQTFFHLTLGLPNDFESKNCLIDVDFGGVVELSNIYPEPDVKTMSGFKYLNKEKIDYIRKNDLWLHIKSPQWENLQILRLFIVTTVWGFFVALTFSSLWRYLKRKSIIFHRKTE